MTVNERQDEVISEFEEMGADGMQKYEYLINLGHQLPAFGDKHMTEENKIKGCQSSVWLHSYVEDERIFFQVESDSAIIKGIAGLLIKVFSGAPPVDVANAELYFIEEVGLQKHLSPTRSNGLQAMVREMKLRAEDYVTRATKSRE
ncbi:MAG: SufE family protein [Candidatus Marinimicrobia bacterium]|nr:SufE family protein [Candidatus Neomarinimicrobiota bacterium]MCF7828125.1 SufE family protein [Candidatus Neomarinimicrobiota bacterium]MCF7879700.1 SufE family protein [Candidatus Neomarinimicrobiota bacterium]